MDTGNEYLSICLGVEPNEERFHGQLPTDSVNPP